MRLREPHKIAARIIQDAGGELVGCTRLQKVTYLSQLAGFSNDFEFEYRHYGPFSEDLARSMEIAVALGPVKEVERQTDWGGRYSVYTLRSSRPTDPDRTAFFRHAKGVDANELELAATAAYLFVVEQIGNSKPGNPWEETKLRKPEKSADGRLQRAADVYNALRKLRTPTPLPELPSPLIKTERASEQT
ncbi:hypothetical protein [Rhodopila sp.]|uniref:hypothetical protein n=1 Tax=Rhodopila sp. TaxID=2480087 RepID=UPI003D0C995E